MTKPRVFGFFRALRAAEGSALPVGVAGFCWGGKLAVLLCQDGEQAADGQALVDAAFTAHPALLDVAADVGAVRLPLSISVGDCDVVMPLARVREARLMLEKNQPDRSEVVIVERATHGFAVRGNVEDREEMRQAQEAQDQAVRWFERWLVPPS